jgi:hypothetical protein
MGERASGRNGADALGMSARCSAQPLGADIRSDLWTNETYENRTPDSRISPVGPIRSRSPVIPSEPRRGDATCVRAPSPFRPFPSLQRRRRHAMIRR